MTTVITVLHVLVCIFLILVVLLQAGKGGGMGIAFGGAGAGGSVFGGSEAGNFLTRLTVAAAFSFMLTSMTLAYLASNTEVDSLQQLAADSVKGRQELDAQKAEIMEAGEEAGQEAEAPDGLEGSLEGEGFEAEDTAAGTSEVSEPGEGSAPVAPTAGEDVEAEVPSVDETAGDEAAPKKPAAAPKKPAAAPKKPAAATEAPADEPEPDEPADE